ncbi:MAG: replicative DNA helicase, partial [Candidatus Marinimicrobia bacterium]|nr:replicative DNA helicase [Candidatus Neomarinimicrobiota bacterium]
GSPGMGKTALALTILRHAAVVEKLPVGIFSLDLNSTHIAFRILCMDAKVDTHLVRTGNLPKSQWKALSSSIATLAETSIFIDDVKSLSPLKMKHNAIRLKAEHDIKLLIIDNNQTTQKQGTQHLTYHLLKQMAVELDIPIVVTSPLAREPEERKNKRPLINDFHHAVEIEESADVIMLLYRPWIDTLDEADRELAEVIIAKSRNGPTGIVNLRFINKYAVFENVI